MDSLPLSLVGSLFTTVAVVAGSYGAVRSRIKDLEKESVRLAKDLAERHTQITKAIDDTRVDLKGVMTRLEEAVGKRFDRDEALIQELTKALTAFSVEIARAGTTVRADAFAERMGAQDRALATTTAAIDKLRDALDRKATRQDHEIPQIKGAGRRRSRPPLDREER